MNLNIPHNNAAQQFQNLAQQVKNFEAQNAQLLQQLRHIEAQNAQLLNQLAQREQQAQQQIDQLLQLGYQMASQVQNQQLSQVSLGQIGQQGTFFGQGLQQTTPFGQATFGLNNPTSTFYQTDPTAQWQHNTGGFHGTTTSNIRV